MRPLRTSAAFALLVACRHAASDPRLQVPMVTDEADAVLAIVNECAFGQTPADPDWQRLFSSEGYRRLKERDASLQRGKRGRGAWPQPCHCSPGSRSWG